MYGSILNQVEPSVNLYSQTTQPSSYTGIWTTTLGVNQVTFVKELNPSTVQKYNPNVMIIRQLDNKNKYKTKLIRTMQIDENSDLYFSGCTINNGQANQIYYGTGSSWVLVNNEYTPPSGGGGELSYNLFAQATEPDTYDGIWTTNTSITSVETTDNGLSEVIDSNMFTVSHMFGQEFIQNGDTLYMISGVYIDNAVVNANGFGTGFIWVYSMITKKLIKTIPIPGCTGLYMHSCVLYNNKIYIIGGRTKSDTTSISDKIYIFDITTEQFELVTIEQRFYANNCSAYNDGIYITCGCISNTSTLLNVVYRFDIISKTITSLPNTVTTRYLAGSITIGKCIFIISGIEGTMSGTHPTNKIDRYNMETNVWTFMYFTDFSSLCRNGCKYVDGKLYTMTYNYVEGASPLRYIESDLSFPIDYSRWEDGFFDGNVYYDKGNGAVISYNNKIYLIMGGYLTAYTNASVIEHDISNMTRISHPAMPVGLKFFGYSRYEDNIFIFGGSTANGNIWSRTESYKRNLTDHSTASIASLPVSRVGSTCVTVDNYIYIFGGRTVSGYAYSTLTGEKGCYRYDTTNNTYLTLANLPAGRIEMFGFYIQTIHEILLIGGSDNGKVTTVYRYNISSNSFSTQAALPTAICGMTDSGCYENTDNFYFTSGDVTYYLTKNRHTDIRQLDSPNTASNFTQRCCYINNKLYMASELLTTSYKIYNTSNIKSKISGKIGGLDSSLLMYKNKPYINFNFGDASTAQKSLVGRLYEIGGGVDTYNTFFNFEIRKTCTSSCIRDNKLYVYAESTDGVGLGQFHEYDLLTQSDPKVASRVHTPVNGNAVLYNNYIYTLGGYGPSSAEDNFVTQICRTTIPAGDSVADAAILKVVNSPTETKRKNHSSIIYGNTMYSVGGYTLKNKSVATNTLIKVNLDDFDNGIMTLTTLENCPKDIVDADAVCISDKIYLLFGYQKSTESFNMDILVYDITNNTWGTDLATTISLRYHKTIVRNGNIYIFGGENATGSVDTIYMYNPLTKEIVTYGTLPNKISRFGLAYWPEKDYAVIAGGYDTTTSLEYSKIFYYDFKVGDFINQSDSNTLYLGTSDSDNAHSTKLVTDSNMKVTFTDVYINTEEPYEVYKGDGTQWIKIT